ncbi:hypothetical protein GLOTRDRAFT_121103 [Gloeophyllum trabeum ATCC 11539]|uniref:GATA-type domain-containing protein n=1 Tax=Gloeophyllum trabeum (strain ATCC 11539 / FP-39264 / Madison 617) TaxID=670483 RepID=S7RQA4_GLOTA|nr:uncharacterized protein GLOTRDRAFT_121103 [Gloeophyllum trabeum ATCC 11539]EPQ56770.1 hypothetical protein GLOTRDRAFT_121103 [Gloeophyllum trabeum ATCC 11539]
MSHRGESMVMPQRRYDPYSKSHDLSHPSPPPIATLTNSPSLSTSSLDRSAVSSPAPNGHHHSQSTYGAPYYSHSIKQSPKPYYASAHPPPMDNAAPPPKTTPTPRKVPQGYGGGALPGVSHIAPGTMRNGYAPAHQLPSQSDYGIILTDDAATKLSDRVRRRCFNCCTTDTSTWRRSTLNPGKVLCNKCGLFERTHSRPRPDQFPHKRGHITSAQRARTPPQQQQLPPMAPQGQQPPPHSYSHPSIAPLFARAEWRAPPPQQKGEAPPARLRPVSPTPPSSRSESPSHAKNAFSEQAHDRPA